MPEVRPSSRRRVRRPDGLERTNDTSGHKAGDALLRRAAAVLRSAVRASDIPARIGGDEFAVLAAECGVGAAALVSRLDQAFVEVGVDASVGMAVRRPGRGGLQEAWQVADAGMYAAKGRRKASARPGAVGD